MNRPDFVNELKRLHRGFSKSEPDIRPERLAALWEQFGHVDLDVYRAAVTEMLADNRLPSLGQQHAAVERHEERARLRRNTQRDAEAKRLIGGEGDLFDLHHESAEPESVRAVLREARRLLIELDLMPFEMAQMLEPNRGAHPSIEFVHRDWSGLGRGLSVAMLWAKRYVREGDYWNSDAALAAAEAFGVSGNERPGRCQFIVGCPRPLWEDDESDMHAFRSADRRYAFDDERERYLRNRA